MIGSLTSTFLKIFFRNYRAMFFVLLLPLGIFLATAFLGLEGVVQFHKTISYNDFLLTGIIAFALVQTGIYTVTYNFIDYQKGQIFKRISVTPVSARHILLAQVIARFLLAFIQVAVLLAIGVVWFGMVIKPAIVFLPFILFFGSTIFLDIGFLIAAVSKDYEQAAPFTTATGMALMFLGDVFFPVENLPHYLAVTAEYLPLKPLVSAMRYAVLGARSPDFMMEIIVLLFWFTVLSFAARAVFSRRAYR